MSQHSNKEHEDSRDKEHKDLVNKITKKWAGEGLGSEGPARGPRFCAITQRSCQRYIRPVWDFLCMFPWFKILGNLFKLLFRYFIVRVGITMYISFDEVNIEKKVS